MLFKLLKYYLEKADYKFFFFISIKLNHYKLKIILYYLLLLEVKFFLFINNFIALKLF